MRANIGAQMLLGLSSCLTSSSPESWEDKNTLQSTNDINSRQTHGRHAKRLLQ
jgi:hypothetical protein